MDDRIALCADASARWHGSWLDALGVPWERDGDVWLAVAQPPLIYFAGIALTPHVSAARLGTAPGAVCDPWQTLDLAPHGLQVWRTEPWFYRPPGPVATPMPPELEIVEVSTADEVYEFEAVSVRGFGDNGGTVEPGTYHPPAILADSAMRMFIGRVAGEPVAAAMGYRTDHVVGVFGVTTVASARRRGYGSALTCASMLPETGLPAVLAPSEIGASMYRQIGFEAVGELTIWSWRGPPGGDPPDDYPT